MKRHTVTKGDSLWKIAQEHKISLDSLLAANPQIVDANYILPGSVINVPELWNLSDINDQERDHQAAFPYCSQENTRPCIYEAAQGETLESIANAFMVPLSRMIYFNLRYGKKEPLNAGSRVVIPDISCQIRDLPAAYQCKIQNR